MFSFAREFYCFLKQRKKLWVLPLLFVIIVFGGLLVLAEGTAIAPFIYTTF